MQKILLIIATLFFSKILVAQNKNYDSLDNTLLWKITSKNITEPIYLYGTIHVICTESVYWPESIDSLVKSSEQVIFEIDVQKKEKDYYDGSLKNFINNNKPSITYTDNRLINPNLSNAKLLNKVKKIHKATDSNTDSTQQILETDLYSFSDLECKEILSFEKLIYSKVKPLNIKVTGLETYLKQYWTLAQINSIYRKKNITSHELPLSYLIDLYILQRVNKMHEEIYVKQSIREINELLFDNRNKKWVKKLKQDLENKPTFIAVGAGHLTGNNGLVHLLRKAGFTVTPVKF